ncbi:MAG: hypothetical protein H7X79_10080 [Sporomusaceae bacterium]|nr:hypothetical protein [Sporomusaceae bacterium]
MNYHLIVGSITLLTGFVLIVVGTDYGRIVDVTAGVIVGAIMILLGAARIRNARKNDYE